MWLIAIVVGLLVIVGPVMVGARIVGAGRTGFWICLGALIVSNILVSIAGHIFHRLGLVAGVFAAAFAYMLVLDTTYLRGLAICAIQMAITLVLVVVLAFTFIGSLLGTKDLIHNIQNDNAPSQSV